MPPHRHTAWALGLALLAGERSEAGLAARLQACLQRGGDWQLAVARRLVRWPAELWRRQTPRTLAAWLLRDAGFQQAVAVMPDLQPRRYLLHEARAQHPLPLGLDGCTVPHWPHPGALATWLGLGPGALWRLSRPAGWQRRLPLAEQPHQARWVAKRHGAGWRLLEVPAPWLQPLQRRLLDGLLAGLPPHQAACGFTRGRSVLDHARSHAGQAVVLGFDLRDFFGSVRAARVHALFATLGYPDPVARTLTALCTTATPEAVLQRGRDAGQLDFAQAQRLRDAHLPQGAPTSPALANLCAFGLDLRLQGLADALGARYTRYADDLVLSGGRALWSARRRVQAWVAAIAADEGFALQPRKTRGATQARRQTVGGLVVNRHPNLPREAFDRLKAQLHACLRDGPAAHERAGPLPSAHSEARKAEGSPMSAPGRPKGECRSAQHEGTPGERGGPGELRAHLRGRVAWVCQVHPVRGRRLQALFDRIDWTR